MRSEEAQLIAREDFKPASLRRGPETDQERWAFVAVRMLAAFDPDGAQELNGVGFNQVDGAIGHQLANETEKGLTPK